jgi:HSP20 family molecular chaperone IbpA
MALRAFSDPTIVLVKEELKRLLHLLTKMDDAQNNRSIPADIWLSETEVVVRFEVPGAEAGSLQLMGNPHFLEVSGIKSCFAPPAGGRYLIAERIVGPFRKAVELPTTVDLTKVRAVFADGVMTVTFQRVAERRGQRRKIEFLVEG